MARRLAGGDPPEVDEGIVPNEMKKKRVKMQALRAKQALDPLRVQAARLAAKRESAAKYRDTHRERIAMRARQMRERAYYSKKATILKSRRRAAAERRALNTAVADLEPLESEGEGSAGVASI
ncbi:hypothetical protein B0H11DRAFT_1910570 [Mycena galericulata]|nr:hypothetical protein B0H11DRAFT_1910570 [Mycena galericulata]